ncbi:hypothetical protein MKX01_019181 [Papaver californicum]|nr:hypothetical protein MKX01_019181 [Papaver californicum]
MSSCGSEDSDHQLHETIRLSTQHIVASIEASSAGIEATLRKVVESQEQNQLLQAQNHQQMLEMLKMFARISTSVGSSNEAAARNSPIVIPSIPIVHDDIEGLSIM